MPNIINKPKAENEEISTGEKIAYTGLAVGSALLFWDLWSKYKNGGSSDNSNAGNNNTANSGAASTNNGSSSTLPPVVTPAPAPLPKINTSLYFYAKINSTRITKAVRQNLITGGWYLQDSTTLALLPKGMYVGYYNGTTKDDKVGVNTIINGGTYAFWVDKDDVETRTTAPNSTEYKTSAINNEIIVNYRKS